MAENAEETNSSNEEPTTPVRRRATRRATAAAGAVSTPAETADNAPATTDAAADVQQPIEAQAPDQAPASDDATAAAPKKRATRSRKKAPAADTEDTGTTDANTASSDTTPAEPEAAAPKKRATRSRKKPADDTPEPSGAEDSSSAAPEEASTGTETETPTGAPARTRGGRKSAQTESDDQGTAEGSSEAAKTQTGDEDAPSRGRRSRAKSSEAKSSDAEIEAAPTDSAESSGSTDDSASRGRGRGRNGRSQDQNKSENSRADSSDNGDRPDRSDSSRGDQGSSRSSRTRQRDRKRRGQGDDFEQEIADDDVLLPIAGILDVLDNYAFVRTSGYLPGPSDVYVSLGQVKKYGLRKGDAVVGAIRQPRENDGGGRQKYNAIVKVDTVNGRTTEENHARKDFAELTPLYPDERILLETAEAAPASRIIDLVMPIGKGQRAFIIGERGTGKSSVLADIAAAVSTNLPDAHLMAVLIDERPEEVTLLQRSVKGEVIASTFDRPAEDHTTVAELSIERAQRLVELGHDVVLLLDSLTALGRAYAQRPGHGRTPNNSVDPTMLQPIRNLMGSARNIENGGSLTIVATLLEKTGSKTDKLILRELAGVANAELRLSRELADEQLHPAVDLRQSFTVREELLTGEAEARAVHALRKGLADQDSDEALGALLQQIAATDSNAALLARVSRG